MSKTPKRRHGDIDMARVAATPRCIAAAWLVAAVLVGTAMAAPAIAALADNVAVVLHVDTP